MTNHTTLAASARARVAAVLWGTPANRAAAARARVAALLGL